MPLNFNKIDGFKFPGSYASTVELVHRDLNFLVFRSGKSALIVRLPINIGELTMEQEQTRRKEAVLESNSHLKVTF